MRARPAWQALRRSRRAIRAALEAAARQAGNEPSTVAPTNVVRAVNVGEPGSTAVSSRQTVVHVGRSSRGTNDQNDSHGG
jgi:hypothetical protein